MKCRCHLVPALARLYGEHSAIVRLAREYSSPGPSEPAKFLLHMILEEKYIFPHLDLSTRQQLEEDHRVWKELLAAGMLIPLGSLVEHTAMEVETFIHV